MNPTLPKKTTFSVLVDLNKHDQVFSQAILDYVTNHPKTAHLVYLNNNILLNQIEPVEIEPDIFVILLKENTTISNIPKTIPPEQQLLEFYSFHKTSDELRDFLHNIQEKYILQVKNKLGNRKYYFQLVPQTATTNIDGLKEYKSMSPYFRFTMKPFTTNRRFVNLFGENIDLIKKRVDFFQNNKEWYNEKGIPYTLGLLLSGPPGTGKTSTIKCIASECNRHIINIHLNNDITKVQMENLFFNENIIVFDSMNNRTETYRIPLDQRLYVLEDVDCQSDLTHARDYKTNGIAELPLANNGIMDRRKMNESLKMDLSFLLNLLDGVLESPGRILVMTTNHAQILDSALIRPGRIDIVSEFGPCSHKTLVEMMEYFYSMQLSENDKEALKNLEGHFTPARVSKSFFEHHENYTAAIQELEESLIQGLDIKFPFLLNEES